MDIKLKSTTPQVVYDSLAQNTSLAVDDGGQDYLPMPMEAVDGAVFSAKVDAIEGWFGDFRDYRVDKIYPLSNHHKRGYDFVLDNPWSCDYVLSNSTIYQAVDGDDWDYLIKLGENWEILEIVKAVA